MSSVGRSHSAKPLLASPLTATQQRAIKVIGRMIDLDGGDPATDASGDLTMCSRNWPATHYGLVRRGLVEVEWCPDPGAWGGDGYWEYTLTELGWKVHDDMLDREPCKVCNDDGYVEDWNDEGDEIIATRECPRLNQRGHAAFNATGVLNV